MTNDPQDPDGIELRPITDHPSFDNKDSELTDAQRKLLRPEGTFSRTNVVFRKEEYPVISEKRPSQKGGKLPYVHRADRSTFLLFGITALVLLGLAVAFMLKPDSGYSLSKKMDADTALSHAVPAATAEGDQNIEVSVKYQQQRLDEDLAAAKAAQEDDSQGGQNPKASPSVSNEPVKIDGAGVSNKINNTLVHPVPTPTAAGDPPAR